MGVTRKGMMMKESVEGTPLIQLIEQGGVFSDVSGTSPPEVLAALIGLISLPPKVDDITLLRSVLEREALMSTAIGGGIALPHPRSPIAGSLQEQCVAVGFLRNPVDWKALDGEPVRTLLLILSSSPKQHLHTLSRINFFCQQESFSSLLRAQGSKAEIIDLIRKSEGAWD
jgi:PTS system nitrogen regulatory IIA component